MFGNMAYNPGAAGSYDMVNIAAIRRNQWMGFPGGPIFSYYNSNLPFNLFKRSHGAGITLTQDEVGFEKRTNINLAYAYRHNVGDGKLSIGLGFGLFMNSINAEWKFPSSLASPSTSSTTPNLLSEGLEDPAVPMGKEETVNAFNLDVGLMYKTDQLYFGVSSVHLNEAILKYQGVEPRLRRHYFSTAGYSLPVPNSNFVLQPSCMVATDGSMSQLIINTTVVYNEKVWFGLSHRWSSAFTAMFGMELFKDVQVGFGYDIETTKIMSYSSGSLEVMIRYSFEIVREKFPEVYRSVRYL